MTSCPAETDAVDPEALAGPVISFSTATNIVSRFFDPPVSAPPRLALAVSRETVRGSRVANRRVSRRGTRPRHGGADLRRNRRQHRGIPHPRALEARVARACAHAGRRVVTADGRPQTALAHGPSRAAAARRGALPRPEGSLGPLREGPIPRPPG